MRTTTFAAIALLLVFAFVSGYAAKPAVQKDKDSPLPQKVGDKDKYESGSLKEIGGKTLDLWLKDLRSPDPGVFENAIRTIPFFGPRAKLAIPIVAGKVKNPRAFQLDISVKVNSAIFLGGIGLEEEKDLKDAVKGLRLLLDDSQAIVRFHAALALGQIGPAVHETGDGQNVVRKLVSHLGDTSTWEIRKACAGALARVAVPTNKNTPPDSVVIYQLRRRLGSQENCAQVRIQAAQTLVMLGPPRKPVERSDLIQTLKRAADYDKDKIVRIWANVGIMRVTGVDKQKERLAFIGKLLKDDTLGIRCQAARAIAMMGYDAKSEIGNLRRTLAKEKNPLMLNWVFMALVSMGNHARGAIPDLNALKEKANKAKDKVLAKAVEETIKLIKKGKRIEKDEKPNKLKREKNPKKRQRNGRFEED